MTRTFAGALQPPLFIGALAFAWLVVGLAVSAAPPETTASTEAAPPTLSGIVRQVLLESIDDEYVDERHWGETVNRFDGIRIRGLRISKRDKRVNHGLWRRFKAVLVRPEETLKLSIRQSGTGDDGTLAFHIDAILKARCDATLALWTYGVKGWNGTAVSDATVRLSIVMDVSPKIQFSLEQPLPQIDLRPKVRDVEIHLKDLDVKRVGVFDGKLVEIAGDGSREAIERLLQQQEPRIRKRLQKAIE